MFIISCLLQHFIMHILLVLHFFLFFSNFFFSSFFFFFFFFYSSFSFTQVKPGLSSFAKNPTDAGNSDWNILCLEHSVLTDRTFSVDSVFDSATQNYGCLFFIILFSFVMVALCFTQIYVIIMDDSILQYVLYYCCYMLQNHSV